MKTSMKAVAGFVALASVLEMGSLMLSAAPPYHDAGSYDQQNVAPGVSGNLPNGASTNLPPGVTTNLPPGVSN
jgi:hypothetical protein